MKVELNVSNTAITGNSSPAPNPSPRVLRQSAPAPASSSAPAPLPLGLLQPAVTFHKDAAGRIYYIVTDPQSGKEIRQVPADAVRKASEGIDEFLKHLEAKQNSHVELKA